ncbi:hypothetical protein WMF24_42650 [Sorangium sp. So ce1335]
MALRMDWALGQRAMTVELTELRSEVAHRFSIAGRQEAAGGGAARRRPADAAALVRRGDDGEEGG